MEVLLARIRRWWQRLALGLWSIWVLLGMVKQRWYLAIWAGGLAIDHIVNRTLFYAQLQLGTRLYATKSGKVVGKRDGRLLRFRPRSKS